MGFWVYMLVMALAVPAVMIGFGALWLRKPPANISAVYGYRTTRSMKNRDTWVFAHRYCGRIWLVCGCILAPVSLAAMLLVLGEGTGTVGTMGTVVLFAQLVPLVGSIVPTERALKRTFDENGLRR